MRVYLEYVRHRYVPPSLPPGGGKYRRNYDVRVLLRAIVDGGASNETMDRFSILRRTNLTDGEL